MATTPEQLGKPIHSPEVVPQSATEDPKRLFDEVLKDKLDQVPAGTFKSDLPGVESITLEPFQKTGESGKKAFWATITYRSERGKPKAEKWAVMDDGRFLGQVPKELKLSSRDVEHEILRLLQKIDISFFVMEKAKLMLQIFF